MKAIKNINKQLSSVNSCKRTPVFSSSAEEAPLRAWEPDLVSERAALPCLLVKTPPAVSSQTVSSVLGPLPALLCQTTPPRPETPQNWCRSQQLTLNCLGQVHRADWSQYTGYC